MKLYSYVIASDTGLAPNPFWGKMTLTVCKPDIRKSAEINDWIIGIASKSISQENNLVYAMKVTEVMTMRQYDEYCTLTTSDMKNKIPSDKLGWKTKVGDCIYKYSKNGNSPMLRPSMHSEENIETDLSGLNSLLSNHFYYFGNNPRQIPEHFNAIVKKGRKHLVCYDIDLIQDFEKWLTTEFKLQVEFPNPQLKNEIDGIFEKRFKSVCTNNKYNKSSHVFNPI